MKELNPEKEGQFSPRKPARPQWVAPSSPVPLRLTDQAAQKKASASDRLTRRLRRSITLSTLEHMESTQQAIQAEETTPVAQRPNFLSKRPPSTATRVGAARIAHTERLKEG